MKQATRAILTALALAGGVAAGPANAADGAWGFFRAEELGADRAGRGCIAAATFSSAMGPGAITLTSENADFGLRRYLNLGFSDLRLDIWSTEKPVTAMFVFDGAVPVSLSLGVRKASVEHSFYLAEPHEELLEMLQVASGLTVHVEKLGSISIGLKRSSKAISEWQLCDAEIAAASPVRRPGTPIDAPEPSFDCRKARSYSEKAICADDDLAARDAEIGLLYEKARIKAEDWTPAGDGGGHDAEAWFLADSDAEWSRREAECRDRACLERWFDKRFAVLDWLANSGIGFGDGGITSVQQFPSGDTLISVHMAGGMRNMLYPAGARTHRDLPSGEIEIVSNEPLIYKVHHQKSYFQGGGAFLFDTLRDAKDRILAIWASDKTYEQCMPRDTFIKETWFVEEALALVPDDPICIGG